MNSEEFRRFGYRLIDWVAEYRDRVSGLPVMSPLVPGEVKRQFSAAPPVQGGQLGVALRQLDSAILPGITHWNHSSFFGYFPSNTSLASVLADLVTAGLGAQAMSWQTSPAATELEDVVMEWLRQMLDLPSGFIGTIHDTASTATLCALLCAREKSSAFSQNRGGLQAESAPLVVYASEQAHSSVAKAALLAGFGRDNLRLIETDDNHALRLDLIESAIKEDFQRGRIPCALVATVGTTNSTALDPLSGLAKLANRHKLWLHVDAALAGCAMILPECRWMWQGVEAADSIVMNPHKWLGVGCDFSAFFVRDPRQLVQVMSSSPAYLQTRHDTEVRNLRDWGIPLGRRFRALKLWFVLHDLGVEGLQTRLRRDLANAQVFKELVDTAPNWERLAPVPLQTVCIRHKPPHEASEDHLRAHNLRIADAINKSGCAFLTPSVLKGRQMLRVSIGAMETERCHVERLWQRLQETAARAE